jgi:hypothetical protein
LFGTQNSQEKEPQDDGFGEDKSSSSNKIRVDVGRGSKSSVLYLNDIEKDPDKSWLFSSFF